MGLSNWNIFLFVCCCVTSAEWIEIIAKRIFFFVLVFLKVLSKEFLQYIFCVLVGNEIYFFCVGCCMLMNSSLISNPFFTLTSSSPSKQSKCSPADVYIHSLIWTLHSSLIVTTPDIRIHLLKCVEPDLFVATGSIFDAWCFWVRISSPFKFKFMGHIRSIRIQGAIHVGLPYYLPIWKNEVHESYYNRFNLFLLLPVNFMVWSYLFLFHFI